MKANDHTFSDVLILSYKTHKINKQDTIYLRENHFQTDNLFTEFVKIERFQGYSNAFNLGLYLRIKDQSSWVKSKQLTGLWKTNNKNVYRGDYKQNNVKTLLLVKIDNEKEVMKVYKFPFGYFPSLNIIETLSSSI